MAQYLKERKKYNLWELITKIYCMFILTIFPIWVDSTGYTAITECKFKTFKVTAIIYFIACALVLGYYTLFEKGNIIKKRSIEIPFKISLPQIMIALYVVWSAISALASRYGKDTWIGQGRFEGMLSCILYSFVFILVSFFGEHTNLYRRGVSFAVLFFCIIGYFQLFKDGVIYPKGYTFWNARFMSTIGNVDMVGGMVSLFLPVLFCSYVFTEDKYGRWVYLADIVLLSFLFVLADVDSGKVGLLVGFAFAFCFLVDERKSLIRTLEAFAAFSFSVFMAFFLNLSKNGVKPHFGKKAILFFVCYVLCLCFAYLLKKIKFSFGWTKEKARRVALIVLLSVMVLCLIVVFFYNGDNRLLKEASEVLHFRLSDSAGSGRGYLWKSALKLATETPLLGTGPGTFGEAYKHLDHFDTYTDFAHNDFIQIAVCTGFVSLAIYVAFVVSLAVRALKRAGNCKLIVIFGSSCAAYLAHSFFSFSLAIITPIFWVMAGLVEKLVRQVDFGK